MNSRISFFLAVVFAFALSTSVFGQKKFNATQAVEKSQAEGSAWTLDKYREQKGATTSQQPQSSTKSVRGQSSVQITVERPQQQPVSTTIIARTNAKGALDKLTASPAGAPSGSYDGSEAIFLPHMSGEFFDEGQEVLMSLVPLVDFPGRLYAFAYEYDPQYDSNYNLTYVSKYRLLNNFGDFGTLENGVRIYQTKKNVLSRKFDNGDIDGTYYFSLFVYDEYFRLLQQTFVECYLRRSNEGGRFFFHISEAYKFSDIRGTNLLLRGGFPQGTPGYVMLGRPGNISLTQSLMFPDPFTLFLPADIGSLPWAVGMDISVLAPAIRSAYGLNRAMVASTPYDQ